ncbi:hypothetical protein ACBJ59_31115 [Nonomuraea sp. MTCD27]|uniref:hypothetical protein n=1 Tax=Nonomuraea sp. MTCD27 TaxID=1676747 RepID=UPI0035BEFEF7
MSEADLARRVGAGCRLTGRFVLRSGHRWSSYGTARPAEGAEVKGRRVLVVEDVVTSGPQRPGRDRRRPGGTGSGREPGPGQFRPLLHSLSRP